MAPGSRAQQSPYNNLSANSIEKQNELVSTQSLAKRLNANSNKALILPEALILPLISPTKDFFIKLMKAFVESTQAWDQEQIEPQEQLLKARSLEIYSEKSYLDWYHFCQQCEDHFKTSGAIGINHIPFAASFFHSTISLR